MSRDTKSSKWSVRVPPAPSRLVRDEAEFGTEKKVLLAISGVVDTFPPRLPEEFSSTPRPTSPPESRTPMRTPAQLSLLFSLCLLVSGCQSFDPTRFWKLNRGENYMNDDGQFSVPPAAPVSPLPAPEVERPE